MKYGFASLEKITVPALAVVALLFHASCATLPTMITEPVAAPLPEPQLVPLSILVTPTAKRVIPSGTRIVVANIQATPADQECSTAVKDALMRRLIENSDYDVLSRDDLDWIFNEMDNSWAGRFDTKTTARLGELLGASQFVVGRINYCGPTENTAPDSESPLQFSIFATLQIIDLATGRVVVSSASEGNYVPTSSSLATLLELPFHEDEDAEETTESTASTEQPLLPAEAGAEAGAETAAPSRFVTVARSTLQSLAEIATASVQPPPVPTAQRPTSERSDGISKGDQYQYFRAAEDLANGFADNFFARPVWQSVEMWDDRAWSHSTSIHYVKLGDCPMAVQWFEGVAYQEIGNMTQKELARYLHNYGVALLCANQPAQAVNKLRSAYRLGYNKTTLRMLGLAQKVEEWSLHAENDELYEVDQLMSRSGLSSSSQ